MKKIAGILLSIALILTLTACNSGLYAQLDKTMAANGHKDLNDLRMDDTQRGMFADLASSERNGEITHIVLHFMSNVIANPVNPYIIADIERIFQNYGVSAHYIIDREGNIHPAVPEDRVAFHAGMGTLVDFPEYEDRLNEYSIGIELLGIGTQEEMALFLTACEYQALDPALIGFTDAQYDALNWLLNDILARHPGIRPNRTHIIGHDEYAPDKPDPGALFEWERLDFMMN